MSIKFASVEPIAQNDEESPLIQRNDRVGCLDQAYTPEERDGSHFRRRTVEKMTIVEALVRALDTTFILIVMQDERHYIGERRQEFVPQDDPELIDHVTDVILSEGANIRRAVESVFLEAPHGL